MTVASTNKKIQYTGDGSTTAFPTNFQFLQNEDVTVISTAISTEVDTILVEGTDYDLDGAGTASGGTVTFGTAPANTVRITIKRVPSQTQPTSLPLGGPLPSDDVEEALDRIVQLVQALEEQIGRAPLLQEGSTQTVKLKDPVAGKVLAYDSSGLNIEPTALADLSTSIDTALTSQAVYDSLIWDGNKFVNRTGTPRRYHELGSGGASVDSHADIAGLIIQTDYYDSSRTPESGGYHRFTRTTTLAKAGNWPNADGYFYDADGKQFRFIGEANALAFGAVRDGVTDDTAALTAWIATADAIYLPTGDYAVTSITFNNPYQTIRMDADAFIVGTATVATKAVVKITAREQTFRGLNVSGGFNTNYTSAIQWASDGVQSPPQYINVFGMNIQAATIGLLYGDTSSPVDAAVSENIIHGFKVLAVHRNIFMNQPNGLLTIDGGVLITQEGDWLTEDAGWWNATTAICAENQEGVLTLNGCTIQKQTEITGYALANTGINGTSVIHLNGCSAELATYLYYAGPRSRLHIDGLMVNYFTSGTGLHNLITSNGDGDATYVEGNDIYWLRTAGNEGSTSGLVITNNNEGFVGRFSNVRGYKQLPTYVVNDVATAGAWYRGDVLIKNSSFETDYAVTGGLTNASPTVTYAGSTASVGDYVTGTGVPVGARVISLNAGVSFTLDRAATATNGTAALTLYRRRYMDSGDNNLAWFFGELLDVTNWNLTHVGGAIDMVVVAVDHAEFRSVYQIAPTAGAGNYMQATTKVAIDQSIRAQGRLLTLEFTHRITAAAVQAYIDVTVLYYDDTGASISNDNLSDGAGAVGNIAAVSGAQDWETISHLIDPPPYCTEVQLLFKASTYAQTWQIGGIKVY